MGAWAIASLFVASTLWTEGPANAQLFQTRAKQQEYGTSREVAAEPHSASDLHSHNRLSYDDFFPDTNARHHEREPREDAFSAYSTFENFLNQNLDDHHNIHHRQHPSFSSQEANDRYVDTDQPLDGANENGDAITSQTMIYTALPEVENREGKHFLERGVPHYEASEYHEQAHENHGEVHYHKHEHVHEHKHKQGHVHQHKQEHDHKHLHNQKHAHEHHSEHKHGHKQEHTHHQEHKHEEHHGHDHKHDHHQDHKHDHHHGHKHKHQSLNKHEHHHGHKHMNKHGHKHIHHSKH